MFQFCSNWFTSCSFEMKTALQKLKENEERIIFQGSKQQDSSYAMFSNATNKTNLNDYIFGTIFILMYTILKMSF